MNVTFMVFQAVNVSHRKVGEMTEPAMYRINDDLVNVIIMVVTNDIMKKRRYFLLSYLIPNFDICFRNTLLKSMNGLEQAGNLMLLMMFKFNST